MYTSTQLLLPLVFKNYIFNTIRRMQKICLMLLLMIITTLKGINKDGIPHWVRFPSRLFVRRKVFGSETTYL